MQRFDQAVSLRVTKTWTLLVDHHKTTSHQGLADKKLHRWTSIYASNFRPHFAQEEEDHSFVKDDGQRFRPGTIRKRLTEIFIRQQGCVLIGGLLSIAIFFGRLYVKTHPGSGGRGQVLLKS